MTRSVQLGAVSMERGKMAGSNAHSIYMAQWRQRYWIRSIFAPGAQILQATTRSNFTASGIGNTRQEALNRCLGETVEGVASLRGSPSEGPRDHDGIAAGRSSDDTRMRAYFEALERIEVSHWWAGNRQALQVPSEWLEQHGFMSWVGRMRSFASARRRTDVWCLTSDTERHVTICKTSSPTGQDPILGFGASHSVFDAVLHAIREAILMEVNLIAIFATRGGYAQGDVSPIEEKIAQYRHCAPELLASQKAVLPNKAPSTLAEPPASAHFSKSELRDGWCVWTCRLDDPIFRNRKNPGPFMNTPTARTQS